MTLMSFGEYARHRGCTLRAVQKALGDPDATGVRHGRIAASLVDVPGVKWPRIDSVRADALWALNTDAAKRSTLFTPRDGADPGLGTRSVLEAIAQHPGKTLAAIAAQAFPAPMAAAPIAPTIPPEVSPVGQPPSATEPVAPADDDLSGATSVIRNRYHTARADSQEIDAENKRLDLEERKRNLVRFDEALQLGVTLLRGLRDSLGQIGARIAPDLAVLADPYLIEQRLNAEIESALAQVTADRLLTPSDDEDDDEPTAPTAKEITAKETPVKDPHPVHTPAPA